MSEPGTSGRQSLSGRAVRGTFWSFLSFFSGRLLTFISTIILARLLVPEEFGIIAYCTIAIAYFDLLNNFGVGHALVARRDRIEEAANAAFFISLGTSVLLYIAAWITAPLIADFFNEPMVTDLFRVLALGLICVGVGTVPMALLKRDLRFKAYLLPGIIRNIIKGIVAIVLAWQGFGVWSLVIAELINKVLEVVIPWAIIRWRPTRAFDRGIAREMLSFSMHIVFVGLLGTFMSNVDYMFVGRMLGGAALGYYTMAYRIPELIIRNTNDVVASVAFPILSKLQGDADELRTTYFGYLRSISLFAFPAGVGLALTAPAFVRTFYTPEWEASIVPFQFISIAIGLAAVAYVPGIIYKSTNRPDLLTKLTLIKLPFVLITLWFATRWGIDGVAAAMVALSAASGVLDSIVVQRVVSFRPSELIAALSPAALGSLAMGAAVGAVTLILPPSGVLSLLVPAIVGVASYAAALALVSRDTVIQAGTLVRSALART